jgi:hypothetical protein
VSGTEPLTDAARLAPTRRTPRLAPALLALLVALPALATVWTRATTRVRIPKGSRIALEDVSYAGRDWNAALTALEVKQTTSRSPGGNEVATTWTFHYANSDREPHYVALSVSCLDVRGKERNRFRATATLLADRAGGGTVEATVRMPEADWNAVSIAKVVVDFLSGPEG